LFRIRHCFDNMPTATADEWRAIGDRLGCVPAALAGFTRTIEASRRGDGPRAAASQVQASAEAAARWDLHDVVAACPDALAEPLRDAAGVATAALADFATYLRTVYLPDAPEHVAVGSERFAVWSRRYAGDVIGADDYAAAAARLEDITRDLGELTREAEASGASPTVDGADEYLQWAHDQVDRARALLPAIVDLDVPPVEVRVQSDGRTYYAPAAEDGSTPATVWVEGGAGPHHVEYEKTVLFHESIPGHHLESSAQRAATHLSRFQQTVYIPAHSEGWGLYAEGLAEEFGLVDSAHARLGCRGSQALRVISLLVDVGLHTGLQPPDVLRDVVGASWTEAGAIRAIAHAGLDEDVAAWWFTNMVGRPAHRASYAAGERAFTDARRGITDLASFHARVLAMGPMGLAQLRGV
jgi:uncharacterized protein (DUF885 family)